MDNLSHLVTIARECKQGEVDLHISSAPRHETQHEFRLSEEG